MILKELDFVSTPQKKDIFILRFWSFPMLGTPYESVQICTAPDRYSRICRKLTSHKYSFEIEITRLKSALQDKHAS